jgi:hypothetical protein
MADEKEEVPVNPGIAHLVDRLNPVGQVPLRANPMEHSFAPVSPPLVSQPRPMLPPPPLPLPSARSRGILPSLGAPERPKTEYALELERIAAEPKAPTRLCDICGNTRMVNTRRNKKGEIVEYHACPKCVDCT